MKISGTADKLIKAALDSTDPTTINGMYIYYTSAPNVPLDDLTTIAGSSGATIQMLADAAKTESSGVARIDNILATPVVSQGSIICIGNTGNQQTLPGGLIFNAGCVVSAVSLAYLSPAGPDYDKGLDYTPLSNGGISVPAGGTVSIKETVSIS